MTIERYLWWIVLGAAFRYAWRSYRAAEAAGSADTSGTKLIEDAARRIERQRVYVGPGALTELGPLKISVIETVRVRGAVYKITVAETEASDG